MRIHAPFVISLATLLFSTQSLPAPYTLKNGKLYDQKYVAQHPIEEHWKNGLTALQEERWTDGEIQFKTIIASFPEASLTKEAHYYLAIALFNQNELDIANKELSDYLEIENHPRFYEEVFAYKLSIAQRLQNGERRHAFGSEKMPKIMTGRGIALDIFDEISSSLPNHELAAKALIGKAQLQIDREEHSKAIETYQTLTRRFPKTQFAIEGYQGINQVYLRQIELEPHNPDPLPLAELNIQKFRTEFPQEASLEEAQKTLLKMQEVAATGLLEIAEFYERTNKPNASIIYYKMAIQRYPETMIAKKCQKRLMELESNASAT